VNAALGILDDRRGFWLVCASRALASNRIPAPHRKTFTMGRFDSRNTTKTRRRRAQAKTKERAARRAEETRTARKNES
jgi:hypothetical protein